MERKVKMTSKHILGFALGLGAALIPRVSSIQAQTTSGQPSAVQTTSKPQTSAPKAAQHYSEGERVFAQNCSRCHTAPDGFSPRISGTVVRHMRVRAQLSKHDEQELLRFLNP